MNALNRLLLGGACLVIIVAGLRAAAEMIGFVLFAGLLATCISPLVDSLVRRGLPRALALVTTILVVLVGGLALATVLGASVVRLLQTLPTYETRLEELRTSVQSMAARFGLNVADILTHEVLNPQRVLTLVTAVLGGALTATSTALLLCIFVAVMLVEWSGYEEAGGQAGNELITRLLDVRKDIRTFVSISALVGLMTAVAQVGLLLILRVDFSVMWGVLSFLFNFIPTLGGLLAILPPCAWALLTLGWPTALLVGLGGALISVLMDNVVKPKLMQQELDISLLVIFLSLMFWSWVFGPIGAILAIPLTLVLKRVVAEFVAEYRVS